MIYDRVLKEQKRIVQQLSQLQKKLESTPAGKLICCQSGRQCKWYRSDGKKRTYIPKSERALAEQLAVKKYLSFLQDELSHELTALHFYLNHHHIFSQKANALLTDNPGFRELLTPFFMPLSEELRNWMSTPYEQNPKFPDQLVHKTVSGHLVRSKSESIIDLFLSNNQIPFRYECALTLGETTLYPDFTIRHPISGEFFYWEHFGLMDDASYAKNACSKLQLYTSHGIIPSINLITTYETQNHPLSSEIVQKIIEHYFL